MLERLTSVGRRLPMPFRFALLSTIIVALAETAIFAVVVLYQSQFIRAEFDTRLQEGLESVAEGVSPTDLAIAERLGVMAAIAFDDVLYRDLSLAVLDADGSLIASDVPHIAEALAPQVGPIVAGLNGRVAFADGRFDRDRSDRSPRFRVALRRLGGDDFVIAAFASVDQVERTIRTTTAAFLFALPLTLIVIGGGAWYVAALVMRPIEDMRNLARRLAPDAIPEEVDLAPISPEVERLQSELRAAMARIDAGYEAQGRFMSNVAHELKTPISVILTQGQTLSPGALAHDEAREFVESTVEEMQRLGRLVESFLMLTRVQQGKSVQHHLKIGVNDLVMDSFESCLAMARTYEVELAPALLDAESDAEVIGDADLLRTAVDNLVRNSIRFSRAGDRVEITAGDAGDAWSVAVRDFGPGIPADLIDRVFDRFAQAKDEERLERGSGLGLEIAQGIAELHGGGISVTNESPGCRFEIRVPKLSAAPPPEAPPELDASPDPDALPDHMKDP